MDIESKKSYLDWLYYVCNRQTDYWLQIHNSDGSYSKRMKYSELCLDEDNNYGRWNKIRMVNARTILKTEICFDFDFETQTEKNQYYKYLYILVPMLRHKFKPDIGCLFIYDTMSNGYHIHLFLDCLRYRDYNERRKFRHNVIENFRLCDKVAEKHKTSEHVTISLENERHVKTANYMQQIRI